MYSLKSGRYIARCATEVFSTTCAAATYIEDCEGWLSDCCGSVAEHRQLKPGVLGSTPGLSVQ